MIFLKKTHGDVESVASNLTNAVEAKGYSVLHVHDLRAKMNARGVPFDRDCRVLEVCSAPHAAAILGRDMRVSLALPCRIAVYEENGEVVVGTLLPTGLVGIFGENPAMAEVAAEVEEDLRAIMAAAV